MSATEPVLLARELYRFFHAGDSETFALRGVSLSVSGGEMIAVIGPSGSGKSSLLACLAGLDEPQGGTAYIAGHRISRRSEAEKAEIRTRHLGILLQSGNLVGHLTIEQNVALASGTSRGDRKGAGTLLGRLGLETKVRSLPAELSGGELARAALATALSGGPEALVADEPTGELDAANEMRILELLQERTQQGAGVLVVTHSERVASAADRVLTLRDGSLGER